MTEKKGHRGRVIVMYISVCVLSVYFRVPRLVFEYSVKSLVQVGNKLQTT